MKWTPIEDLPAEADDWIGQDYLAERVRWHEASTVPQDPALDRSILMERLVAMHQRSIERYEHASTTTRCGD